MDINIKGNNCEVGRSLSTHIRDHLNKIIVKYQQSFNCISSRVNFTKDKHHDFFITEVLMSFDHNIGIIKSVHKDSNPYMAFNYCYHTIKRLLSKYKDKNNHFKKDTTEFIDAQYSVFDDEDSENTNNDTSTPSNQNKHLIVAEYKEKIFHFSVEEAVMHMEISGKPALLFINKANDTINMVYHRDDGTIGWTDPDYKN